MYQFDYSMEIKNQPLSQNSQNQFSMFSYAQFDFRLNCKYTLGQPEFHILV